jgi:hypothetical protein
MPNSIEHQLPKRQEAMLSNYQRNEAKDDTTARNSKAVDTLLKFGKEQ